MNSITLNEERDEEAGYGYCNEYQPHAVKRMFDYKSGMLYDMRWDEAGNLGQVSMGKPGEMFEKGRFLFWTEDNRMHAAVDDKYFSYYVYDHSGGSCASREQSQACLSYAEMEQRRRSQRRLKLTGDSKLLDVCQRLRTPQNKLNEVSNADLMATYTVLNEPTLYPSAYMVLSNKGYTNVTEVESRASSLALPRCSNVTERKHYYAGTDLCASREQSQTCLSYAETKQSVRSNRVAARLGGGGLDAQQHVIAIDDELQWRADKLFIQSLDQVNLRVLHENDLECIMRNKFSPEVLGKWIEGIPYQVRSDVETEYWQFKEVVYSMLEDRNQGHEKDVYFYHSDLCGSRAQSQTCLSYAEMQQSVQSNHLGGASWITDVNGKPVQHLQYLPFGEPYVNQHSAGYQERFTFTGKERDEETGFGYFGARYMDHELMTMWLSVDPMAGKYPSISPYAYCAWNPVKLVDPDGCEIGDYYTRDGKWVGHDKYNDKKVYVCDGVDKNGHPINRKDLGITHDEFREKAATVYGESSAYRYPGNTVPEDLKHEMFAIASVHEKNDVAYGNTSAKHNEYIGCTPNEVNGKAAMVTANAAVINALTGGFDYSYEATQWDGAEQALFPADNNKWSTGKWELHMNTMGWTISDEHYETWKTNVGKGFKAPQEKEAVVGPNKGQKRLVSTAVYCRTIFWKQKK